MNVSLIKIVLIACLLVCIGMLVGCLNRDHTTDVNGNGSLVDTDNDGQLNDMDDDTDGDNIANNQDSDIDGDNITFLDPPVGQGDLDVSFVLRATGVKPF